MGYADLHIHSIYSYDGICTIPAILEWAAGRTDLDVIAITDHDSMAGLAEAQRLAGHFGIEVIPGVEVSTAEGHLLALFVDRPIPAGLSLAETLRRIRQQDGVAVAPHPTGRGASSLSFAAVEWALADPEFGATLVGIEAFNAGLVLTGQNDSIAKHTARLPLAQLGNSDAHTPGMIGKGSTEFDGRTASDLRAALLNRSTRARPAGRLNAAQVVGAYLPAYLLRLAGWGLWTGGPGQPLYYRRLSSLSISTSLFQTLKPWFVPVRAER